MDISTETTEKGVVERRFDLKVEAELVPGILWEPESALAAATKRPTILIGHGGTQHKRTDNVLSLARTFVRHLGVSVAALDAPGHGDRVTPELRAAADTQRERLGARIAAGQREGRAQPMEMSPEEAKAWVDRTTRGVTEWKALIDDLQADRPDLADGPFGYWGVSMGTAIGLPFVADEPRITAAVLGLAGLSSDRPGSERFAASAASLSIPVLFLFQANDELMTLESGVELFKAFGSKEKTMHLNPGGHVQTPAFERKAAEDFFARHLFPTD
jgi:pimeloyl-ACP methyl ester carboxylesterase